MKISRKFFGMILGTSVILVILIVIGILVPTAITAQVIITAISIIGFLISVYMGTNTLKSFITSKYFRPELQEGKDE